MRKYKEIPNWWFHLLLVSTLLLSLALCIFMKHEIQMPWWGLIFAAAIALAFTLPVSIITATTNQVYKTFNIFFVTSTFLHLQGNHALINFHPFFVLLTCQTPGLNIVTEYIMGYMLPGRPIANVVFKTYGYISMAQAVSFLNDFKLGHYMKIPPRSMFFVQVIYILHSLS